MTDVESPKQMADRLEAEGRLFADPSDPDSIRALIEWALGEYRDAIVAELTKEDHA